jgi:nucleotide-binding universal stress UspA family protein
LKPSPAPATEGCPAAPPTHFDHVLVATDFSVRAAQAVARGRRLPLGQGALISLLHVLPEALPRKHLAAAERAATRGLEETAASLTASLSLDGRGDVGVRVELCRGQAYVEIIRRARAAGADLTVLGRNGQHTPRARVIGSTAERVIRMGGTAVLVVTLRATRAYRRPLIAVALDDTARTLAELAVRAAGSRAVTPLLVHAYHAPFEGFVTPGASEDDLTEYRREHRRLAIAGMDRVRASLGQLAEGWQASVVCGDPRAVLLAVAERRDADLIVVGTHGRGGLSHVLVGSVAEWIIRNATCDVLVARSSRVTFELP